jgi:hypothetical protein
MQDSLIREFIQAAELLKRRIELKQRLWPQLALLQFAFDNVLDLWIGNPQEASDVRLVVRNDFGMCLKDVHGAVVRSTRKSPRLCVMTVQN